MANRPGNEDRTMASSDREREREVSSDNEDREGSAGAQSARTRSNRGFASMDTGKQKEIASKGGRAAHAKGTAHEFDSNEAREAGRKGGMAVSRNREHMAMIGRRGGEARGHARARNAAQTNTQAVGGNAEGSVQNTRSASPNAGSRSGDREVEIPGQSDGYSSTQGSRGGNSSLGGENRANTNDSVDKNPNH